MAQPQELGLRAQVLDVVPPGPIHRNRRSAVAKFSHRIPNFRESGASFTLVPDPRGAAVVDAALAARRKEESASRLRPSAANTVSASDIKVPLLLEQRDGGATTGPPSAVYKGVPEAGGGSNTGDGPPLHYILFRSGDRVTAFPADQWLGFKPHVDRRGLVDSVNAAAAAAAGRPAVMMGGGRGAKDAGPKDPFALRLVPKSQRLEKQRQEEEAREQLAQVAAGRLMPLGAAAGFGGDDMGRSSGRLQRFVDEDDLEAELFGDDEEEDARAPGGKFGGKAGRKVGGGRGRAMKNADGTDLAEDEVPEDLYGGGDDQLRPEKPEEAEDWEHEFAPDDDDQDQGASEEYDDDPGMRKKLGIEGDDDDEGEEADEQAKKLKQLGNPDDEEEEAEKKADAERAAAAAAAAAAATAAAAAASAAAGEDEGEDEDEEGESDLDELDEMDEEAKPPPVKPPAPTPPRPTPPPAAPAPAPAAAASAASAAGAAGAGAKRKADDSRAALDGAKRARTATPPPARVAAAATAAAGGAAGAAAGSAAKPAAAAAGGGVTAEDVVALLRSQPTGSMPFQDFTRHFIQRTPTPDSRKELKALTVSLCKSSKTDAGVLMVELKPDRK